MWTYWTGKRIVFSSRKWYNSFHKMISTLNDVFREEVALMATILDKKNMTEEDIKLQYITPAVTAKWDRRKITMETQITDGRINLRGNLVSRGRAKRADYLLYLNAGNPIAVIEAKDNNHSVSHGLQQAMEYAQMMDLPFAYSSNGDGFAEHDFLTGTERQFGLDEFPQKLS